MGLARKIRKELRRFDDRVRKTGRDIDDQVREKIYNIEFATGLTIEITGGTPPDLLFVFS